MTRVHMPSCRPLPALLLLLLGVAGCESSTGSGTPAEPLIIVEGSSLQLDVGESVQLTARGGSGPAEWGTSAPGVVTVVPVTGFATAVGPGQAVITATRGGQTATIAIVVVRPPTMVLSRGEVILRAQVGGLPSDPATLTVTNSGDGSLGAISVASVNYVGAAQGWLSFFAPGGFVNFAANPGSLPVGSYSANVAIAAANAVNSPQNVVVTFEVEGVPVMAADPDPLQLSVVEGEDADPVELVVRNTGGGTLTGISAKVEYPSPGRGWLGTPTVVPGANGATIRFTPDTEDLQRGTYSATVEIESTVPNVESLEVDVVLTVASGPLIVVTPTSVAFTALTGQPAPAPRQVQITNGGGGSLISMGFSVIYGSGVGWLNATINSTEAPATITMGVSTNLLSVGTYNAVIRLNAPFAENTPVDIPVSLTVAQPGVVVLNPSSISVSTVVATVNAGPVSVNITEAQGRTLEGIALGTIQYGPGATNWLAVNQQPGPVSPTQFRVQAIAGGLTPGTYTAELPVLSSSTSPTGSPAVLRVTQTVQPPSFAAEIYGPLGGGSSVAASCGSCHGGSPAPNLRGSASAVRAALLGRGVVPGNPDGSSLICRITPGQCTGHTRKIADDAVRTRIRLWIQYGANP
jgi:hypothetical protein